MKKITLALALFIGINMLFANPVDSTTAKKVAVNFWKQNNAGPTVKGKTLRFQRETPDFRLLPTDTLFSGFYIFNAVNGNGFVIVSANDNVIPILGYSMEKTFQIENMPPNLKDWLNGYEQQIQRANMVRCSDETRSDWGRLLAGEPLPVKSTTSVTPLLTTHWDQGCPYNLSCPYDYDADDYTYTGCVATAMAQVMKYWEYPQGGVGSHTYTDPNYGVQSVNFETGIAWNEMLNDYSTSTSYTLMQASAISSLMYMCGVSVDMNYGVYGSGISNFINEYGLLPLPCPETALKTYFNYSDNLEGISKSDFTSAQWISILKNELDSDRVILYTGHDANNTSAHAFVCDGYSNNNNFHFNWGWSGYCDGYYSINNLAPGSGGSGSGNGNYTYGQQAIIHITPSNQVVHPNYDLVMNSTLTTSDTSYLFGPNHPVTINCAVANTGNATFNGYLVALVSDLNGNIVAEISSSYTTISPNHYVNKSFTVQGGLPLGPGRYFVIITSATNLNDPTTSQIVRDNLTNMNFASFKVTYEADIETYSDFEMSEYLLYSGQSVTVNVDIANYGSSAFYGDISVALLSLSGSYVQTIQQYTLTSPLNSMTHYTNGLDFTGVITAPAGDYFLTLRYSPQGSSYWYYAGSYFYQNPVRITIHDAPVADIYEANNTLPTAYSLIPVFSDDMAEVNTNGANFHNSSDVDYFKIILPSGYSYQIIPVLQDFYYNDDITYSVDAKFYVSNDAVSWSNAIDNDGSIMDPNTPMAQFNDGGVVYFKVLPSSVGDIGTYSLHVYISRQINPDIYEPNNTASTAYNLGTVNTSSANYTVDANFHVTTDNDYYKINLPSGYFYTINASILNSYNNSNYSADAKFATSQDGANWSSNYGSTMPALTITDGGVLYFRVLPYTDHEIGTYQLQIAITRTGGVEPDIYEPNNTASAAYNLGTVNTNDASYTVNANFHLTTDNDYYKIILPSGYSYTINANLHDSYNDNSFTADAKFATSENGATWSSDYGVYMPALTMSDGGVIYFRVLPYTDHEIGTYQLQISITRTGGVEPDQYEPNNTVSAAYNLGTVSSNSTSYTLNANFHLTTDNDYYKIILPAGYTYTINANILNSYNNNSFTAHAIFSTSQNGNTWSSDYGDAMPVLTINDGGVLYFRALPYTDYEIGTYQLQINVTRTSGIDPDIYEPNNTVSSAFLLALVDENETTIVADASFHTPSDADYYQINLPPDYTYSVVAVLFDRTNDPTYTGDAKIVVSTDFGNSWSSYYDSYIPSMTFEHSGRPYYRVVPQQDGATGTYRLQISVSRITGISDYDERVSLYPNPTNGVVNLQLPDSWQLNRVEVLSPSGTLVKSLLGDARAFNVSDLARGVYLLKIYTSNGVVFHKMIKQ
ncbi:MAG: thiol protease/hemagglutinin PrtT [Bacteroidales bacterium]|nr:thiol protease/hemagglutinin PrtT [Bacteroidales bacterium]